MFILSSENDWLFMAKKIKKNTTKTLRSMPTEDLLSFARKNMDEGNLRIARDAYKELIRTDRPRFISELLICYNRLAEQMINNKQLNEAKMLLALIKELGGEAAVTVTIDSRQLIGNCPQDMDERHLEGIFLPPSH